MSSSSRYTSLLDRLLCFFVSVHGGTAVWLRRRPIHPVKPAPTLGRFYSNHPSVLGPARQVRQVPFSSALRARSVLRANWPPTCLGPEHLRFFVTVKKYPHRRARFLRLHLPLASTSWRCGVVLCLYFALVFGGCSNQKAGHKYDDGLKGGKSSGTTNSAERLTDGSVEEEKTEGPPKRIFAKRFVVAVREAPNKQSYRIGYLRGGAVLMATTARPVGNDRCRGGWYQLETGGFVCAGSDALDFSGNRLPERRATQPDLEAHLPYRYGCSVRANTPIYRRLPTDEEAAQYEGYRIPSLSSESAESESGEGAAKTTSEAAPSSRGGDAENHNLPNESNGNREKKGGGEENTPRLAGEPGSASQEAPQTPEETGPPTLQSLMGERGSVLVRRMEKGFYTSLDREMDQGRRRYWQTQANGFIPYNRLREATGSDFHGVQLSTLSREEHAQTPRGPASTSNNASVKDGAVENKPSSEARTPTPSSETVVAAGSVLNAPSDGRWMLPIAFIIDSKIYAYTLNKRGLPQRAKQPGYHYSFQIVGEENIRGKSFYLSQDGKYFRVQDVTRIAARQPPNEIQEGEKWIDVDIEHQTLVAYEGSQPVYATLISSGRVKEKGNPQKDFETPTGSFRILSKHISHTMDGDQAVDGPYSIEDVPYVMYFQLAYALHSAFWHNSFGRPHSHGCINMAPIDAKWLFEWTTPQLPKNWHSVYPTNANPATRLYVHGQTPVR
jgi:lipoprotein-anchoring transpeptidase ErfK/SrfK